jgi:uncharacterized membrane protein YuzA (DUF378 family)
MKMKVKGQGALLEKILYILLIIIGLAAVYLAVRKIFGLG